MPKPQHIHEVYIRTTPARLWQALTDPELTKSYYYGCAVGSTWEPGAAYAYVGEMGPGEGHHQPAGRVRFDDGRSARSATTCAG